MTIPAIIESILNTPELQGTSIELAALVARRRIKMSGAESIYADAIAEVSEFWIRAGGTVESSATET